MNTLNLTPEIEQIARRVVWFEPPERAIANPARFLAYVMTYGGIVDMNVIRRQLSEADLREAIENAPAGIFDPRKKDKQHLDPGQLARLDSFFHQLAQHGIWTNLNLHVSRAFTAADGFEDTDRLPGLGKVVGYFAPVPPRTAVEARAA